MTREVAVWLPQRLTELPGLALLVKEARVLGGARALDRWLSGHERGRAAYVHGERHGLWWEFSLADSFRWQGHISRMRPTVARQRTFMLTSRFGLTSLLEASAAELTPDERSRADLAVALLAAPDLLLWEEPRLDLAHLVRDLCRADGTTVVAVGTDTPWLHALSHPERGASRAAQ